MLVQQPKSRLKTQEPPLPQQHADNHALLPQQQQPISTTVAVPAPEKIDTVAIAVAEVAAKGEYSDSSFIYEDNSGSESELGQESAPAASEKIVLDTSTLPSHFVSKVTNGPSDALFTAAVS